VRRRCVLLALAVLWCTVAAADTLEGTVVGIADGDTLTLLDEGQTQHRVRLAGIDAPEKRQAFGTRAQQALANAVFRRRVTVVWHKRDRYGRLVAKVVSEGHDVGLALVSAGLAWHYKSFEQEQSADERTSYADAEVKARQQRLGLWRDASPVPPWEFRRR